MAAGQDAPPFVFVAAFPFFFIGLWLWITYFLSRMSGWRSLQAAYPNRDDFVGRRFRMQSASVGGAFGMPVNYNRCLTIDANSSGLRFKVWAIFGLFQQPVLIPWRDIAVDRKKFLFFTMARLKFARWEGGEMAMRIGSWNRIAAEAPSGGFSLQD